MNLTYNGKHANVSVRLPNRILDAARGDSVEVTTAEGRALKKLPGWTVVAQDTAAPEED